MDLQELRYAVGRMKRRVTEVLKSSLINDIPPALETANGERAPNLNEFRQFMERYRLSSILPYESYDPETGLYYNRDTVGFMLYANPATGIGPSELNVLNGFFNQQHMTDTSIQISLISDTNIEWKLDQWRATKHRSRCSPEVNEIFGILAENRANYFKKAKWKSLFSDQAFLLRDYHLVISYVVPVPMGDKSIDLDDATVQKLLRYREATVGTLRSANIPAINMQPGLFINILNGVLNPSDERLPELEYDDENLISKQIVDHDTSLLLGSGCSSLIHKGKSYSVLPYHARAFPRKWAGFRNGSLIGSFTNNILRLPCPFVITLGVNVLDQVSAKGEASAKSVRATQMVDSEIAKYVPVWKDRKQDWDYTMKKIEDGNKLMEAYYQILLFSEEGKEQECEQAVKSIYDNLGWTLSRTRYIPLHSLMAALPMGLCQEMKRSLKVFGHYNRRLSWSCTNLAPWVGEWKGTKTPLMLMSGRRGQLTFFDPFDNDKGNFNISCMATSGSGKSFITQELVFSILGNGGRAFVIDAGHSYRNLCTLLQGTYMDFGTDGRNMCLNPFSDIPADDPEAFNDQLPLLKMLIAQMASPNNPLSAKQSSVLEKAIMEAWNQYGNDATVSKVIEVLKNDSSADGPMHATAKDLAVMLFSYSKEGMYGRYWEGKANINLDNTFVVLDLDALNPTPDLQSVVLLMLMMRITQVMYLTGAKDVRKLCIIDEAWRLLGSGTAGKFIEEGYRVARKHGGSFMTITQKVSDYYSSETAKSAFMNSDFALYLRQKPEELKSAETKGHIDNSDGKIDVLRSLETIQGKYSEVGISSPSGLAVCRFIVDPITEKIYSTKAEEVAYLKKAQAQGVSLFEAIQQLIQKGGKR